MRHIDAAFKVGTFTATDGSTREVWWEDKLSWERGRVVVYTGQHKLFDAFECGPMSAKERAMKFWWEAGWNFKIEA